MTYSPRAGELCCACISHRLPSSLVTTTIEPEPEMTSGAGEGAVPRHKSAVATASASMRRSNHPDMTSRALLTW